MCIQWSDVCMRVYNMFDKRDDRHLFATEMLAIKRSNRLHDTVTGMPLINVNNVI